MVNCRKNPGFLIKYSISLILLASFFLTLQAYPVFGNQICSRGTPDLLGDYDVIQSKGGLWGFMEKSSALKDKSVVGLQADSKIRRTIRIIENLCKDGKSPTPEIFKKVQGLLGDARLVFNKSHSRTPPEKILEIVMELKTRAEGILKDLGE